MKRLTKIQQIWSSEVSSENVKSISTLAKGIRISPRNPLIGRKIGLFTAFFQGALRGKVVYLLTKGFTLKKIIIWVSFENSFCRYIFDLLLHG